MHNVPLVRLLPLVGFLILLLAYEYLPTTIRSRPEKGINLESSLSTGSARSGESKNIVILRAQIFEWQCWDECSCLPHIIQDQDTITMHQSYKTSDHEKWHSGWKYYDTVQFSNVDGL